MYNYMKDVDTHTCGLWLTVSGYNCVYENETVMLSKNVRDNAGDTKQCYILPSVSSWDSSHCHCSFN